MNIFRLKSNSVGKKSDYFSSASDDDIFHLQKPIAAVPPNPTRPASDSDVSLNKTTEATESEFLLDEGNLWAEDDEDFFMPKKEEKKEGGMEKDETPDESDYEISKNSSMLMTSSSRTVCDFDLMDYSDVEDFIQSPENATLATKTFDSSFDSFKMNWEAKSENLESLNPGKSLRDSNYLEIDDKVGAWVDETLKNEAFSSMGPDTPHFVLEKNLSFIRNSYIELLEKITNSYESIPLGVLKEFPGFDSDVFLKLKTTRKRMKATMIRASNLLERSASKVSPFEKSKKESDASLFLIESPRKTPKTSPTKKTPDKANSFIDYTNAIYKTPVKDNSKSNLRNDGGEFEGFNFQHSKYILKTLEQKFGLKSFRPNQLQVINAAMLSHDCFVLMPTGGGKSLCYQLPAVISVGVTVVISPLKSLILDQVTKMLTLDIPAAHLSGDMSDVEARSIYNRLNQKEPTIKLLYVTPEKVGSSSTLKNCLAGLYKRGMLARFVIDEVHCVSQWGHDFRPDYTKLKELRENYPGVKIMALTATATPRVRTDILHQLKMDSPKWFLSSFNRSNLVYHVKDKKGKSVIKEIAELIQKEYKKETGVIYCFSRKECEDVAAELKKFGVDAAAYHAGLDDKARTRIQNQWMNDKVKVVCATIAFGMGVDKLDVRFVIHFTIPKSIEGYYQESGRAGRDGVKAVCILYYAHRDKLRVLKLINMDQTMSNPSARKIHIDNLFRVVAYAENKTDCRRALQLEYLGEKFDRRLCLENRVTACDNCLEQGCYNTIDVTEESKAIVSAVKTICGRDVGRNNNYTMLHFVDIFKGATGKKVIAEGHNNIPLYGKGKAWLRLDIERLFRKLIMEEYLKENLMVKDEGISFAYLKAGRRADSLLGGNVKIEFDIKKTDVRKSGNLAAKVSIDPELLEIQERCYGVLMDVIKGIASALNCNPNAIMNIQAIRSMSQTLPETPEEMLAINHVTEANFEKYGAALLDVTKSFAEERKKKEEEKRKKKEEKPIWPERPPDESEYFEPDVEFLGKKRKRKNNFHKFPKRAKGSGRGFKGGAGAGRGGGGGRGTGRGSGRGTGRGSGRGGARGGGSSRGRGRVNSNPEGITTVPLAQFSTLMQIPVRKTTSAPKTTLKNL